MGSGGWEAEMDEWRFWFLSSDSYIGVACRNIATNKHYTHTCDTVLVYQFTQFQLRVASLCRSATRYLTPGISLPTNTL